MPRGSGRRRLERFNASHVDEDALELAKAVRRWREEDPTRVSPSFSQLLEILRGLGWEKRGS